MNRAFATALILTFLTSCRLAGIHMQVENPSTPGAYPSVSDEMRELGTPNDLRTSWDQVFCGLDIFIDAEKKSLSGWVEIRGKALQDMDSLQIDLDQKLELLELRRDSRSGPALTFDRYLRSVRIKWTERIAAGTEFSMHVLYNGQPEIAKRPPWAGGTVWKKDKHKNAWLGVACESEGASIWFPCKDLTNDEPDSAVIRLTIPDNGLTAVSNGILEKEETANGKRSFTWRVHYPINLYNITYYVGDFVKIDDHYTGINGKKLLLTHYVLRDNEEIAREHFKKVIENIRTYEEIYGAYSFYDDGFKLIESPYAGMEHQSAIAYGSKFKTDLYGMEDYIMLHETGHEWFGNAISCADLADVWLQEGITTYGESLYLERQYGKNISLRHLYFYRLTIKNQRPVVGPLNIRYFNYKDSDVYVKGAWILHTLRHQIQQDSLFFRILRTFYERERLKVTDSETFVKIVNEISGSDYKWFFDQYLYRSSVPVLEYQLTDNALYYRWTSCDSTFNKLMISVSVEGVNESITLMPDLQVKKLPLPLNAAEEIKADNFHALFGFKPVKQLQQLYREN